MTEELISYQNGKFLPASALVISPWDLGFLRGYGVFDVLPVINGKPFLWEWHWERLERSAKELLMELPISKEDYGKILQEIIEKNLKKAIILRTVVSGGVSQDAFSRRQGGENFLVLAEPAVSLAKEVYQEGASVMTLDHVRSLPKVKMTQYVTAIQNLEKRKALGALETLYIRNGEISECAQSNFFIVRGEKIITTNENALLGITQKLICEVLAPEIGQEVKIRPILLTEVLEADEAFLTGSNKGIVPIVKVDERVVGSGKPGPVTKDLIEAYRRYCNQR